MADAAPLVLGIDVGQTAVKAVVHDGDLRPIAVGRSVSPVDRPAPHHAERSHDALWGAVRSAIAAALAQTERDRIAAVAISGHGDGLHLVDAAGRGVGPAITAMDGRAWREAEEIATDPGRSATILQVSGQAAGASSPGALLLWTARNHPDRIDAAHAMVFCKDAVRLRLTGEIVTDYSDATASFLDTGSADWSPAVLDAYGVGGLSDLLPPLQESAATAGGVGRAAAAQTGLPEGIPVLTGLHDVHASAIGMGSLLPGRLACVAGSFNTNGVATRRTDVDPRWQSRLSVTPDLRIAMSTSSTASPTLDWALRLLGAQDPVRRDRLFAEAAALPLDDDVPTVLPFFAGSPPGLDASGSLSGLRGWHGPAHLIRGVLEGIALMHHWHVSALAEAFAFEGPVALGGGIARSGYYAELVAQALGRPVRVSLEQEPGAFGAAALAAVHLGLYEDLGHAQAQARLGPEIEPCPDSAAYWERARERFASLAASLLPWWKERANDA
ncbi:FGGY-family carbohydrate kinase [Microbacterium sp. EF45047]|uniref:FGGY-family carbohydrate kinase n=1 Tax=Microbacterium sp. EF45047 TaxID=2809708 RepID=UPI00234AD444|nr:FGGY family carbohydrate kinase [Microbacterium sp. EF45047]WCM55941.1 hypothetical protein JRG78_01475 [Microbacterium sp. EF45047]